MSTSDTQVANTPVEPSTIKPADRHSNTKRRSKGRLGSIPSARKGSKTAKILALLGRPDGASLKELKKATGWQAHSVRGFLSGALKKKMGLRVGSKKRPDGERAYRIPSR